MASSSTAHAPAPNLATLLSIKRKMATKTEVQANTQQLPPPPPPPVATGAHSNEKITYRQDVSGGNPLSTTAPIPGNTTDQPKVSRKTKQLEVGLLDKKMEEINRKQEEKTNEALDTWKGFDSVNYGFTPGVGTMRSTPVPPAATKQRTPTPPRKRESSPVKDQSKSRSKEEESPQETPPLQKTYHKEPSSQSSLHQDPANKTSSLSPPSHEQNPVERQSSPSPPPIAQRRSKMKSPEQLISKSITSVTEDIVPISMIISDPQLFKRSSLPFSNDPPFKLFPDIKHYEIRRPRHAVKSIQRSMDRYRFHVW